MPFGKSWVLIDRGRHVSLSVDRNPNRTKIIRAKPQVQGAYSVSPAFQISSR